MKYAAGERGRNGFVPGHSFVVNSIDAPAPVQGVERPYLLHTATAERKTWIRISTPRKPTNARQILYGTAAGGA